jgi:hypothetical protein
MRSAATTEEERKEITKVGMGNCYLIGAGVGVGFLMTLFWLVLVLFGGVYVWLGAFLRMTGTGVGVGVDFGLEAGGLVVPGG